MKQEYQDIITSYLGVKPIQINSSLVSAQYRRRLYWTNIPNVDLPKDKNIVISDILEDNIDGIKLTFDENGIYKGVANNGKSILLESNYQPPYTIYESRTDIGRMARRESMKLHGKDSNPRGPEYKEYRINKKNKCNCILTTRTELDNIVDKQYNYRPLTIIEAERLQTVPDNYTNYTSHNQRWKMLGNGWTVDVIAHVLSYIKKEE
jgi:site-specific DNA-cytosine methylase